MNRDSSNVQNGNQGDQQRQSSIYSSGINLRNGPAMNNVATSSTSSNTVTTTQSNSGNNHTITNGQSEPMVEARRIIGKCEINDRLFKFSLDSGCDLTTISEKVAAEAKVFR